MTEVTRATTEALTEFLLARIAEDEAAADAVLFPPPGSYSKDWKADEMRRMAGRVLAECEAKRRAIFWAEGWLERDCAPWNVDLLRILAAVYADHEDFQEEWATGS